ncbi:DUF3883 domain-containing protein [Companilactobacillus paralimentarius]|nr:DUF3883 domain-containing protein [Companilactobacillus paralimentarius]
MSTDKALSQDLNYMITVYQELKESLYTTFDKVNAHIVKGQSLYKLTEKIENKKSKSVNKDMILIENPTQIPTNLEITKPKNLGNTKRKPDYINNLERNTKQGLEGEELVIKNQIDILSKDSKLKEYVDQIKHLSVDEGDGAGYDILSFKKDTKNEILEHYIEVKSTKSGIETPFFMSSNELEVARTKGKQYSIYRLYKNIRTTQNLTITLLMIHTTIYKKNQVNIKYYRLKSKRIEPFRLSRDTFPINEKVSLISLLLTPALC